MSEQRVSHNAYNNLVETMAELGKTFGKLATHSRNAEELAVQRYAEKTHALVKQNRWQAATVGVCAFSSTGLGATGKIMTQGGAVFEALGKGIEQVQQGTAPFFQSYTIQTESARMFDQMALQQHQQNTQTNYQDIRSLDDKMTQVQQTKSRESV